MGHDGNIPGTVQRQGKPSQTRLKVVAHCHRNGSGFSLVAIRIRTGRRHQIRTHTSFIGHPTVCDGKYTPTDVFMHDREWCERNFLHRYHVSFADKHGKQHDAFVPLPGDLVDALRCLTPTTRQSEAVVAQWITGTAVRDWQQYSILSDAAERSADV